jgi:type IV secretion system protein TrbJ
MNRLIKFLFLLFLSSPVLKAQIPVTDTVNFSQNLITAVESVAQTLQMIEAYKTQLEQYQNQIQNTLTPPIYLWNEVDKTISNIVGLINTIDSYKNQLGSIDVFLSKFKDINYYKNINCFNGLGCSEAEKMALAEAGVLGSESQKKSNDAILRAVAEQQSGLVNDSFMLKNLQSATETAKGRMEALQYGNQLASASANQLMLIRSLLIAQNNAWATRQQAIVDREAQERAADEHFLSGTFRKSPEIGW